MRVEFKVGLLFNFVAIVLGRTTFLPNFISGFLCGLLTSIAIFALIIGLLPKNVYDNLLYRKCLTQQK